jgi:deoxyribodipyrimidine photo-lyase
LLQSEKFDPDGDYIRHWLPELTYIPTPWIHKPWLAPERILSDAGIQLGSTYPLPIVVHEEARREALAAFENIRR